MKIFLGADHRGFELKNKLKSWLLESGFEVVDLGNKVYDPLDDFPDFSQKVAKKVLENPGSLGIVICGSGVGVCIAVNRFKGIRCALGFDENQVASAKADDHCNMLALAADFISFEKAKSLVKVFIEAKEKEGEKYLRRIKKIEQI